MASYSESLMPPPLDNRPVGDVSATIEPTGTLYSLCGNHNCSSPGACR